MVYIFSKGLGIYSAIKGYVFKGRTGLPFNEEYSYLSQLCNIFQPFLVWHVVDQAFIDNHLLPIFQSVS